MTAKEKAEELVLTYLRIDNNTKEWFNKHIAKQCALIAVDEIINICPFIGIDFAKSEGAKESDAKEYWIEVKQEINQLITKNK